MCVSVCLSVCYNLCSPIKLIFKGVLVLVFGDTAVGMLLVDLVHGLMMIDFVLTFKHDS